MGTQEEDQEGTSVEGIDQEGPEDSPFTVSVNSFPLPSKFRMLQIESYDGAKDPLDHLESFKTLMHLQGVADEIMYKAFPTTLKGPARIWQLEDETLRSYIASFNKEVLSIDEADDKILVAAFTNGLRKGKFLFSLYKKDPKIMSDVLYRATKYMNAEDALLAREEKPKKREKQEDTRQDRGQKMTRTGEGRDDRRFKPPAWRFTSFTPLTTPIDQVLMQIKDEVALTFPEKLKGDPNKWSRDKYCRFHCDYSHDTADCYDLKQ
ncbi:uncharacterized protein LOC126728827 [Quercus robur]|uniref:uncharacterized protein LOC126728827 n=1 Tax=Quercus robur TaxID=38942 RepID=UPI0021614B35|nr:uncharacterized protein LOC126728827 [Quercus robur]